MQNPFPYPSDLLPKPSITDRLLHDIYLLRESATKSYEDGGGLLYFGQVEACEIIREKLLSYLDEEQHPQAVTPKIEPSPAGFIDLTDAVEPGDPDTRHLSEINSSWEGSFSRPNGWENLWP